MAFPKASVATFCHLLGTRRWLEGYAAAMGDQGVVWIHSVWLEEFLVGMEEDVFDCVVAGE